MSFDRFAALVRAYGVREERWPQAERPLFARHAATPDGKRLLAEEAGTDRMLAAYTVSDTPSPGLAARIQAIARKAGEDIPLLWEKRFLRLSAFSCAACLILGLLVGLRFGDKVLAGEPSADMVSRLIFGAHTWQGDISDAIFPE